MPDLKLEGYHGTTKTKAETIIEQKMFIKSNKRTEWLGKGIYFFAKRKHACWWASNESKKARPFSASPALVIVTIKYTENAYFDLDLSENMKKMREQIYCAVKKVAKFGTGHPEFKNAEEMRCFYCNLFQDLNPHIKVYAYTFPRAYRNDLGFDFIDYQRQYCVTDNNNLVNMRMEEVLGYVV